MLRVDLRGLSDTHIEYSLTGSLTAEHVWTLQHLVATCARRHLTLTLHLAGVDHIDDACLMYLIDGEGRSVRLSGIPAALIERLRRERDVASPGEGHHLGGPR